MTKINRRRYDLFFFFLSHYIPSGSVKSPERGFLLPENRRRRRRRPRVEITTTTVLFLNLPVAVRGPKLRAQAMRRRFKSEIGDWSSPSFLS